MYVKFDYTEDDLVDAALRFLKRSKGARSSRVRGIIYWLVATAVMVVAAAVFINYLAAAAVAGVMLYALGYHQLTYWESMRGRLHKFMRAQHGQNVRAVCEVELTPVGVCVRQTHTQTTYEWEVVEEITASDDAVNVYTRTGGGVIVRARAFKDAGEVTRFMDTAAGYIELSRASAAPDDGIAEGRRVGGVLKHG